MKYILLVAIVPHDRGELVTGAAVAAGSFGGTVLMGRGISANGLAAALGMETSQDVVYILTEEPKKDAIVNAICTASSAEKSHFGSLFSIDADSLIKTGTLSGEKGENSMTATGQRELITVILNRGYADDAMAAARKAGAGGGTVINARGTAREDDAKFFGMHIVPEKEMLLLVVEHSVRDAVLEAIRTLSCLSEPGSGIAFCSGVTDFVPLGKK